MNKLIKIILFYLILYNNTYPQFTKKAEFFFDLFINKKYLEAYSLFDSTVKSKMDLEQFSALLPNIEKNYGNFLTVIDTISTKETPFEVYNFGCKFEKLNLNIKIVVNQKQEISGFWITPYTGKSDYKIPDYVNVAKFREVDVEFGLEKWKISGTLTIPTRVQKPPVVILIHGSGPNDRDETIGPNKPFKDLAWGIATNKIAVLRYDKRTKLYGHKIDAREVTVRNEVIEDALEAIKFIKNRSDLDTNNVFLIGHSLGAMLSPAIVHEAKCIKGVILLASPAKRLEEKILEQFKYIFSLDGKIEDEERTSINQLEKQIDSLSKKIISEDTQILGMYPRYFYELANLNPIEYSKKLNIPILIMQGERDYQVTMEDFDIWKKELGSLENVKLISYPNLNHLFMSGEGKSTPEEILKPNNVSKAIIDDIINWIQVIKSQ